MMSRSNHDLGATPLIPRIEAISPIPMSDIEMSNEELSWPESEDLFDFSGI
jgi:hypothetical protein